MEAILASRRRKSYPGASAPVARYVDPNNSTRYTEFYGEVLSSAMPSVATIRAMVGNLGTAMNTSTPWLKFGVDGRIFYTPKKPITGQLNWSVLYSYGLVWGTNDNGLLNNGIGNVNQYKTLTYLGTKFKVCLWNCLQPGMGILPYTGVYAGRTEMKGSDWMRLIPNIITDTISVQEGPKFASYNSNTDLGLHGDTNVMGSLMWGRERVNANDGYMRAASLFDTPWSVGAPAITDGGIYTAWRPVLEIVK